MACRVSVSHSHRGWYCLLVVYVKWITWQPTRYFRPFKILFCFLINQWAAVRGEIKCFRALVCLCTRRAYLDWFSIKSQLIVAKSAPSDLIATIVDRIPIELKLLCRRSIDKPHTATGPSPIQHNIVLIMLNQQTSDRISSKYSYISSIRNCWLGNIGFQFDTSQSTHWHGLQGNCVCFSTSSFINLTRRFLITRSGAAYNRTRLSWLCIYDKTFPISPIISFRRRFRSAVWREPSSRKEFARPFFLLLPFSACLSAPRSSRRSLLSLLDFHYASLQTNLLSRQLLT